MSYISEKYLSLFQDNWSEALRTARLLKSSYIRLADKIPLDTNFDNIADDELLDKLDAFRVRFSDLQDCIGNKIFRNLLKLEGESFISMIDVTPVLLSVLKGIQQYLQKYGIQLEVVEL